MRSEAMSNGHYFQQTAGISHPYEHKLRLRSVAPSPYCRNSAMARSLTVTNFQMAPRTTFEMERPMTQGSPRLVVINTSFRSTLHDRKLQRKHIPTFPELSTDAAMKRKSNVSRLTNSSITSTTRMQSGHSAMRREPGPALKRRASAVSGNNREHSGSSDKRTGPGNHLTPRQSNTFTTYAKYNDIMNSSRTREKTSDLTITGNNNDLSALVPERSSHHSIERMSNEKHSWISDWVASTSAALKLDDSVSDESAATKPTLSVIQEN